MCVTCRSLFTLRHPGIFSSHPRPEGELCALYKMVYVWLLRRLAVFGLVWSTTTAAVGYGREARRGLVGLLRALLMVCVLGVCMRRNIHRKGKVWLNPCFGQTQREEHFDSGVIWTNKSCHYLHTTRRGVRYPLSPRFQKERSQHVVGTTHQLRVLAHIAQSTIFYVVSISVVLSRRASRK